MTSQVFEVGDKVIRTGFDSMYLDHGKEYEVDTVDDTMDLITVVGNGFHYDISGFELSLNNETNTEVPLMPQDKPNTDEQEITENLLRTRIVILEDQVSDLEEQLKTMNNWWYEEKTKVDSLKDLVIKQAAKLVD